MQAVLGNTYYNLYKKICTVSGFQKLSFYITSTILTVPTSVSLNKLFGISKTSSKFRLAIANAFRKGIILLSSRVFFNFTFKHEKYISVTKNVKRVYGFDYLIIELPLISSQIYMQAKISQFVRGRIQLITKAQLLY